MNDFERISARARLQTQQTANQMAQVRNQFGQQLLRLREEQAMARDAGDKKEAAALSRAIRDEKLLRDQAVLSLQQQQIADRQALHSAMVERQRRKELIQTRAESVRVGGAMVAAGATAAIFGVIGLRAMHQMALGAAEYERQAALTLTQTTKLGASVESLQDISNSVASSIGVPLEQLQPALYDIFSSMNVSVAESQVLLRAFAKEAVAGQVSIQDASRATIGIMNAYQIPVSRVNEVLDFQFQLVKLGVGTFKEFATTIGLSVPSAVRAGQSYQTLGAMLAFMTRSGMTAARATASAGRALDAYSNPSVVERLKNLGDVIMDSGRLSAPQMRKLGDEVRNASIQVVDANGNFRPLVTVMGELGTVLHKLPPASRVAVLKEIFKGAGGTIQARRFFDLIAKGAGNLKLFIFLAREMGKGAGAYDAAYQKMADTTAVQTERMSNNFKILKNALGAQVMPAMNDLIERTTDLLIKFNEMEPSQKRAIANTALYGSVLLALVGTLVAVAGAIKIVSGSIGILSASMSSAALASNALVLRLGAVGAVFSILNYNLNELKQRGFQNGRFLDPATFAFKKLGDWIGLDTDKILGFKKTTAETLKPLSDQRKAMYEGTLQMNLAAEALGSTEAAMKFYDNQINKTANGILDFNNLTEDQAKVVSDIDQRVSAAIPIFEGYHKKQEAMATAAAALKEAQIELSNAQGSGRASNDSLATSAERVHDAEVRVTKAKISLKNTTGDTTLASIRLKEAQHDLQRAQSAGNKVDGSSVSSRERVREATLRVKAAEEAYRKAKGVTAKDINKNLREEVLAYEAWARNTQKLLKRGADPKFVQALSQKGPEYVAAYVKGSDKQMVRGQELWTRREEAKSKVTQTESKIALGFIKTMARLMNKALSDDIDDEVVKIGVQGTFSPPKGLKGVFMRARGGIINRGSGPTADDVPAMVSRGEYVVNAKATQRHRPLIEAINKDGLGGFGRGGLIPHYAGGGAVDPNASSFNVGKFSTRVQRVIDEMGQRFSKQIQSKFRVIMDAFGPGKAGILKFIKSVDPLPYIWGGVGPRGYDCSGLVGEVMNRMQGRKSYQRLFTTGSIRSGLYGLKPGLGGTLQIGVTSGSGHMAGRYGGLGFEAESTRTGIKVGAAASRPESFARRFHLAQGGYVDPDEMAAIMQLAAMGVDIGGDAGHIRAEFGGKRKVFDNGGFLLPGTTVARNNTGRAEVVMPMNRLNAIFKDNLRAWVVPWLKRIAVGIERSDTFGGAASTSKGGRSTGSRTATRRRLTARQLSALSDAQRWAYVDKYGRPPAPSGYTWAEDHTIVPNSFYDRTSYDTGGWLMPGTTIAKNNTGRPERVLPPGEEGGIHLHFHNSIITGGKAGAREFAKMIQMELLKVKRENGGVKLGLT